MAKRTAAEGRKPTEGRNWQLQEAKARFSELFRLARSVGAQRVTRHGNEAVVVIPAEEYERFRRPAVRRGSLAEFFASSPLAGSGIDLTRGPHSRRRSGR
jgi:prevent-host-death family protein